MLEVVADRGAGLGIGREDLSYLRIDDLLALVSQTDLRAAPRVRNAIEAGKATFHATDAVRLSPLIAHPQEVYCFSQSASMPNFVGSGRVRAPVALLEPGDRMTSVRGRVVVVECADPGFDWIFAQGAAGLVTQYGGPNSHMAVRCAELGLPAALGCGEPLYRRIKGGAEVLLDCEARMLEPIVRTWTEAQCAWG